MEDHHLLLLSQETCAPNMKLACLQIAGLGWLPVLPWKQGVPGQAGYELLSGQGTYVPHMKLDQKSFKQQSLKCMPLLPWLQHFYTNKLNNLLSLPESTCLPSMPMPKL